MTEADVLARTRAYIVENFLYMHPDLRFGDAESLLKRGVVDSMGVLELVQFLQEEFGIEVADDEITEQNFDTLAALARYVTKKLDGARVSAA